MKRALPVLLTTLGLACASAGSTSHGFQVTPLGETGKAKPPKCPLDILFTAPDRPYEPIANLAAHLTAIPPGGAPEALRAPACEMGADAVIVTRNQVLNMFEHVLLEGTAIRYVQAPTAPPPEQKPEPEAPTAPAPEAPKPPPPEPPATI